MPHTTAALSSTSTQGKNDPAAKAKDVATSREMELMTRAGYIAKGVLYVVIGGLALLAANNAGGTMVDNNGAVQVVAGAPFGRALLGLVTAGLACYAFWYVLRGILDLDRKGKE